MSCVQEGEETNFHADVVLIDGSRVSVRTSKKEDAPLLLEFFEGLSEESVYFRFLGGGISGESAVRMMLPGPDGASLVALKGGGKIVANAAYYVKSPGLAEIGVVVADDYRRKGLGTILLGQLSAIANRSGVHVFEALIAPENYLMIETVRNLGYQVTQKIGPGYIIMRYPTSPLPPIPVSARR